MPYAETGLVRLHYELSGQGPPLVLIPGWTLNVHLWDRLLPFLEPHFQVLRYDPRGAGLSTSDPRLESSRLADAEDLEGLMNETGLGSAHLVGHSKGARIAFVTAMRSPRRALSVAGIGSAEPHPAGQAVPNFRPVAKAWVEKARQIARSQGPEKAAEYLRSARLFGKTRTSPEGAGILLRATEGYRAADLLSRVPPRSFDTDAGLEQLWMPVLYLCGEEDPFLPECRYAHERVPHSRFETLPGCGHLAPIERPELVAPVLLDFLRQ